jgi:hypothetical protein
MGGGLNIIVSVAILSQQAQPTKKKKPTFIMRLPGVEPGSIAWKAIILTVGLQTLFGNGINYFNYNTVFTTPVQNKYCASLSLGPLWAAMESLSLGQVISATHQGSQRRRNPTNPVRRRRTHTQIGRFRFSILSKKSDFQGTCQL